MMSVNQAVDLGQAGSVRFRTTVFGIGTNEVWFLNVVFTYPSGKQKISRFGMYFEFSTFL